MIFIALGANLPSRFGVPEDGLDEAVRRMEGQGVRVVRRSSVWLTAPVPVSDQPWYRNAVVAVETGLAPLALLEVLKGIEADMGRVLGVRNASRVIDLDILAYDDVVMDVAGLSVPHPRMHERAFVLFPLREVAPNWVHPVLKMDVSGMIAAMPEGQEIEKMDDGGVS
ncbi:MAG: 2-amino-4-hydroxy-6-hydroxymethyldihydropteridine diphosphokinase [Alphaproteobacteria bacterium]